MCRFAPVDETNRPLSDVRRRIAATTTPVLINRCKETLKKFVLDEQKSGTMELPRQRINEVIFILEKLKSLETYHSGNKRGHLVNLMPIFADLIMSN